jgi:hypothetical protein
LYDDEDGVEGGAANGQVLELRQDVRGWVQTRFFECQIQGSTRADRRSSFDSCISGDLKKEVRFDMQGGRLETAEISPTPEMFKIEIDYKNGDGRLSR